MLTRSKNLFQRHTGYGDTNENNKIRKMDYVKRVKVLETQGNLCENWRKFIQAYEIFETAAEIAQKPENVKIATFLNAIGDDGLEIYNILPNKDKINTIKLLKEAFVRYCEPKKNVIYERFQFYNRNQKENEPFENYMLSIKKLVKSCEFGVQEADMVRDRIVIGINDSKLQEKLLQTDDLDLTKAIEICKTFKMVKEQTKTIQATSTSNQAEGIIFEVQNNSKINKNKTFNVNYNKNGELSRDANPNFKFNVNKQRRCRFCSYEHLPRSCPAYGKKCSNCNKLNHFASMCGAKSVRTISIDERDANVTIDSSNNSDEFYINAILNPNQITKIKNSWKETISINNILIEFKLDSGSDVNIISAKILKQIDKNCNFEITKIKLKTYGGHTIDPLGLTYLVCSVGNNISLEPFVIIKEDLTPILGLESCNKLGLIKRIYCNETEIENNKTKIFEKYKVLFDGLGNFPQKYKIEISNTATPTVKPPRRVALKLKDKLKDKLDKMELLNIITKVHSAREWVNNMVIVEKKNGDLRICLDPCDLNKFILKHHYLIPTFEEMSIKLKDAKYFSVLDLKDGFWQVSLDESSRHYCTFSTPFGYYEFNRMPFGISTAPEVFQKFNSQVFGHLNGVVVYIDDILIMGRTLKEHDENLEQVLQTALKNNIKFNKKKNTIQKNGS